MTETPRIVCILVNWNGYQDTIECLDSLASQDYPNLGVIVVDNGSTNDSVEQILRAHPWVALHQAGKNLGFPAGCNIGTRIACQQGADFIWLLNNDTIAPPSTASSLARTAVAHPEAGAIGSVLYYRHDPSRVQAWGGGKFSLLTAYVSHFDQPQSFAPHNTYFTGASLLIPRAICEKVGLLYEGFFMYCDDSDFSLRLHRGGYPLVMCEDTAILHKEGGSKPRNHTLIDQFSTVSTLRLLRRHAPVPVVSIGIFLLLRLAHRIVKGRWRSFAAVCRGVRVYWVERHRVFSSSL